MKFEYNSDLDFSERVHLVAHEIVGSYPNISYDDALLISSMDNPIDNMSSNDDKFRRYYYIFNNISSSNSDFYKLYQRGFLDNKYKHIFEEIINYSIWNNIKFHELCD